MQTIEHNEEKLAESMVFAVWEQLENQQSSSKCKHLVVRDSFPPRIRWNTTTYIWIAVITE